MTDKERLNAILRLRLFYSTEKELGDEVGLNLKGNHFNRLKTFDCEAIFSKFAKECNKMTGGKIDLANLICQYEITSKFFQKHIKNTSHEKNKQFIQNLLNHIYMKEIPNDKKDKILCERYDDYNKEDGMNVSILILMTYGLIPTFKNKKNQDVSDIKADFEEACNNIWLKIAQSNQSYPTIEEGLKTLIEFFTKNKDIIPNRVCLILFTNCVIVDAFASRKPTTILQNLREMKLMDISLPRLWHSDDDADNIVWEFLPSNLHSYFLFRREIDYKEKKIRFTMFQVVFKDKDDKNHCETRFIRPSFRWHNILNRTPPKDSILVYFTDIEYENDKHTVKQLTFKKNPFSEKIMTLKTIDKEETRNYYVEYLDRRGRASDYEYEDTESQYAVYVYPLKVAASDTAILFKDDNDIIYKLDKFDEKGQETIPGIASLTHTDYICYAGLNENGKKREFLCLDYINKNIDLGDLSDKPYFHKIEQNSNII